MKTNSPIKLLQDWLISEGKCPSCGRDLREGKKDRVDGLELISCKCNKMFIREPERNSFRRAYLEEYG